MSNHYSAANLKFPGDDARLDFTDLWVFPATDPGKTVVVIDVNPFATGMSAMPPFLMRSIHPDGVYRINVDRDGDALAEAAFTFTFSERTDGKQTGTLLYATGAEARRPEPGGDVLIENTPVAFDDARAMAVMAARSGCSSACAATVLRRRRRLFPRLQMDRPGRVRGQEHPVHRDGNTARHAQRRPGDRAVGVGQPAPARRLAGPGRPGGIRPSTPSSTRTTSRTPTTWGSPSTTSRTTWPPGPSSCRTTAATPPRRRSRRPASCCRTSFATTAASRSGTRMGAP